MFETIPQAIIQFLLLSNVIFRNDSSANVQALDVYASIISAIVNCIFQILRLRWESQACEETFSEYCLECLMARISWIPFEKHIFQFLNGKDKSIEANSDDISTKDFNKKTISYDIKYSYPCGISKMIGYKPKLQFDFSSISIQKLLSTIKLSTTTARNKQNHLLINFGKSLRLLNFQDLMNLFQVCLSKEIKLIGFNNVSMAHLLTNSMNISANAAKDVRLLSNCRNSFGKPFVSNYFHW